MSRIVVALGGNALLRRGEPAEAERRNVLTAASAIAARVAGTRVVGPDARAGAVFSAP